MELPILSSVGPKIKNPSIPYAKAIITIRMVIRILFSTKFISNFETNFSFVRSNIIIPIIGTITVYQTSTLIIWLITDNINIKIEIYHAVIFLFNIWNDKYMNKRPETNVNVLFTKSKRALQNPH